MIWDTLRRVAGRRPSARTRFVNAALLTASIISLTAILSLRLYAALALPAVHTPWDDDTYRAAAASAETAQSSAVTTYNLMLPHFGLVIDGRLNGYIDWLAVALKVHRMLGIGTRETTFQILNTVMLFLQAAVLFGFARWSLRDRTLALTVAFLFIAAPMVFGTSRWVHTENLVFLAGLSLSGLAAWLLESRSQAGRQIRWSHLGWVAAAAWGIGLCAKAREYAAPSFIVLFFIVEVVLLLRKRWLEAIVLDLVTGAFIVPWAPALVEALKVTLSKGGASQYFHSLTEWFPHVAFYTIGPALTVLLLSLGAIVIYQRSRTLARLVIRSTPVQLVRAELSGVRPLFWGHLFLLVFYFAFLVWSRNRVTRPAVPIMLAGLGLILIGIRTLPYLRAWLLRTPARLIALALIVLSWSVLAYQLVFAFDGGKLYAHHGFRLEYFNYPLRLRQLKDASDSYICVDLCIYDKR